MTSTAARPWFRAGLGALCAVLIVGLGVWLLFNPQNWFSRLFESRISSADTRVVMGPYPSEDDFSALRANGVTTDVSLLDPDLPYERGLLDREKALAAKYGLAFANFPMASVFGVHIGSDYDRQARLAAAFVAHSRGRVYVHCYLGMHRVRVVAALLGKSGTPTATYLLNKGERSADSRLLDEAQADYDAGRYPLALKAENGISSPSLAARLLAAWSHYRLGDTRSARMEFAAVAQADSAQAGAFEGLGYCALRNRQLEDAASLFLSAKRLSPKDASAYTGLGLARYRQGRINEAKQEFTAAVALNPADADAQAALAKIH